MGKQIRFYITQTDAKDLIDLIYSNGGILISTAGDELTKDDLEHIADVIYIKNKYIDSCVYIKLQNSNLQFDNYKRKYIDYEYSDVIEFSLPRPIKHRENTFSAGRFWYATSYYNKNNELIKKTLMKGMFNLLQKYIRKNYIANDDKSEYIGLDCYEKYKRGEYITTVNDGAILVKFE